MVRWGDLLNGVMAVKEGREQSYVAEGPIIVPLV